MRWSNRRAPGTPVGPKDFRQGFAVQGEVHVHWWAGSRSFQLSVHKPKMATLLKERMITSFASRSLQSKIKDMEGGGRFLIKTAQGGNLSGSERQGGPTKCVN